MAEGRNRFQFRTSTVALLTAVVALSLSLFLITARHNAQLWAMTQRHNAQLWAMTQRHNAQLDEMTARHGEQLRALAARVEPRAKPGAGGGSVGP
ncbi:MAG: hypothetical protein BGO49_22970 [Planctomycetales bacterium 71-10]|nr:MAG: hypothetical protein BGO49_22970 [Planctomycetales bacterium 71-10]